VQGRELHTLVFTAQLCVVLGAGRDLLLLSVGLNGTSRTRWYQLINADVPSPEHILHVTAEQIRVVCAATTNGEQARSHTGHMGSGSCICAKATRLSKVKGVHGSPEDTSMHQQSSTPAPRHVQDPGLTPLKPLRAVQTILQLS